MSFFNINSVSTPFAKASPKDGYTSDSSSEDEDVDELHTRFTNKYKQSLEASKRSKRIELGPLLQEDQFAATDPTPGIPKLNNNENPILDVNLPSSPLSQAVLKSPEEEQRLALEYEKGTREAKQQLMQLGTGIVGCAVLGVVAAHASVTALPYIVAQALSPVISIFNTASQFLTNKHALPTMKGMAHYFCSTVASVLFGKKKAVTFGGGAQSTAKGDESEQAVRQLFTAYHNSLSEFLVATETTTDRSAQLSAVEKVQKSIIETSASFILSHGTEEEKRKIQAIEQFQKDYETYINGIPAQATRYKDLPLTTQNQLRQLIHNTLTSQVPELIGWGKRQAQAIGMTSQAIDQVVHSQKKLTSTKF